ncbi:MAG TPA: MBL fold metallo-hydrolase [Pseudolysinimonas sp.]|jgi:L-ascorbate metabolism protein UlaG (beta-lactamase superfamily)|nr:MBL fold metallo-hydrolase [Pseudolysinimonas sp.]
MKVTKYEHATLLLSVGDDTLVIDPGMFLSAVDFGNVAGIVITHEHGDHWTPDQLGRILEKNPDAPIYGPAGVQTAANGFDVTVVKAGDEIEAGPFTLKFFGETHALIHESVPAPDNLGVLVNDELYYPGDSYTVPDLEVGTLAAPLGAPWLKIGEAMDFVLAVKPKRALYAHDMTLSAAGKKMHADRLAWATEKNGGVFHPLEVGESLDI